MDLREGIKVILNKNREYVLNVLIFITGFSIPFSYAFNSICIGCLFVFSFCITEGFDFKKLNFKERLVPFIFIAFFSIQVIGIFYSYNFDKAFSNVIKALALVLLPIAFINISNKAKINLSLYGLLSGVLLIITSAYGNIFFKIFSENLSVNSLFTQFVRVEFVKEAIVEIHPPYLGLLIVFIIMPVYQLRLFKNSIARNFLLIYLMFSLYSISSFMSIVMLGILIIAYFVISILNKNFKPVFLIFAIIGCCFIFVKKMDYSNSIKNFKGGSLFKRIEWSFIKGKWDTSRPENWESVISVSKKNLFLGVGSDGGLHELNQYRNPRSESFINKHNAHNQYLEILLRYGILGLIMYLVLIIVLIFKAIKSKDERFIWFVVVFSLSCIVESYLQRQIGLTFFVFYALIFDKLYSLDKIK